MTPSISFSMLLAAACGRLAHPGESAARLTQLALTAMFAALGLAALWGVAVGSGAPAVAAANLFKVPLVITMSALCALPGGLLAMRLSGAEYRASDLALAFATSLLGGSLVLGALAPIVAIYYHTSARFGVQLGILSVALALAVGSFVLWRNVAARAPTGWRRLQVAVPTIVMLALFAGALIQFVALASPIMVEPTAFDGGIDRLVP